MTLPFEAIAAHLAEEMGCIGFRMVRAKPVQQRQKMRPVRCAVTIRSIMFPLDGEERGFGPGRQ